MHSLAGSLVQTCFFSSQVLECTTPPPPPPTDTCIFLNLFFIFFFFFSSSRPRRVSSLSIFASVVESMGNFHEDAVTDTTSCLCFMARMRPAPSHVRTEGTRSRCCVAATTTTTNTGTRTHARTTHVVEYAPDINLISLLIGTRVWRSACGEKQKELGKRRGLPGACAGEHSPRLFLSRPARELRRAVRGNRDGEWLQAPARYDGQPVSSYSTNYSDYFQTYVLKPFADFMAARPAVLTGLGFVHVNPVLFVPAAFLAGREAPGSGWGGPKRRARPGSVLAVTSTVSRVQTYTRRVRARGRRSLPFGRTAKQGGILGTGEIPNSTPEYYSCGLMSST